MTKILVLGGGPAGYVAAGRAAQLGAEVTLDSTSERTGVPDPIGEHLVILAKGAEGYARLSVLLSEAHLAGGTKGQPSLSLNDLARAHGGHWRVLTGCRKGPLASALANEGPSAARRRLDELIAALGRENLAVEIWDHGGPTDTARNDALALAATAVDVELVVHRRVALAQLVGADEIAAFFQQNHVFAGLGQDARRCAAATATADDEEVALQVVRDKAAGGAVEDVAHGVTAGRVARRAKDGPA